MGNLVKLPFSDIGSTLELLSHEGVREEHWNRLRSDESYRRRVAGLMLRGGLEEGSVHQKLARALMGQNFFGLEEWATLYGANFTKKQLREVAEFPWGEDILNGPCPFVQGKLVKDTHFAFLGVSKLNGDPLTVMKWHELHPATGQPKFYHSTDNPWHRGQPHTDTETMELRWYLMLKEIMPDSTSKMSEEQVIMLPAEYEVPTTIAEVTKDILAFRKTGGRPNYSRWAACKERTVKTDCDNAVGYVSCVGNFDEFGLEVYYWTGDRYDYVGLGASRKFPN